MAIIASCRPNAEGLYPDGAWINLEPVYEGFFDQPVTYGPNRDKGFVRQWDAAQGVFVEQAPAYGPYRPRHRLGFKPQVSPEHVLHYTYEGCVLSLGENNGYDDSDFFAVVWDHAKGATDRIIYASTRGWTYDLNASVDATDEVKALYADRQARDRRRWTICDKRNASKMRAEAARRIGVRMSAIRRLETAYGPLKGTPIAFPDTSHYARENRALAISFGFYREAAQIDRLLKLLVSAKGGRLKNAFKKKLAEQVMAWLADPAPQYATPLSPKQAKFV